MQGFNARTQKFNQNNAYWLGFLANLAYEEPQKIETELTKLGCREFTFFDKKETQAFICQSKTALLLSFRGTESKKIADWLTDLKFKQEAHLEGMVHRGFYQALDYIYEEILTYIQDKGKGKTIWITGHSLGAALAVLVSARLKINENINSQGIYTFGEPKVGDKEFSDNYDHLLGQTLFRYVNNNDIVPRVPLKVMSYYQVGQQKYFDSDGILNNDMGRLKKTWDRVKGRYDDLGNLGPAGISDHSMNEYLSHLDNARKNESRSEMEQFLVQAMSQLQTIALNGYQKGDINIPVLDPCQPVEQVEKSFEYKNQPFKLTINNPIITGISTFYINSKPQIKLAEKTLSFTLSFEQLALKSQEYHLDGTYKLIFKKRNLSKEGHLYLTAKKITVSFLLNLDFVEQKPIFSKQAIRCEIKKLDLDIEDSFVLDLIVPFFKSIFENAITHYFGDFITQILNHQIQDLYASQISTLTKIKTLYDMKKAQQTTNSPRILEGFNGVGELPLPLFWELPSVDVENTPHMSINDLVEQAQTGDVILFAGSYPSSQRIRRLTQSCFSHVVIVIKDPAIADGKACIWQATSSTHRGVLRNMEAKSGIQLNYLAEMIEDYRDEDGGAVVCWRKLQYQPAFTPQQIQDLIAFIKEMDGKPYTDDMDGLYIMGLMEVDNPNKADYFCAGLVAQSHMKLNILKDTFYQYQYAPRDFSDRQPSLPFVDNRSYFKNEIVINQS